jgi:pimeloyl-ACP methyl ester carboxylesterase
MSKRLIATVPLLLILAYMGAGCSIYGLHQSGVQRKFTKAGLIFKTVDLPDAAVKHWEGGQGPTIVLLHGFGGDAKVQWLDQVGPLAERYHLLVPNLVHFGGSTAKKPDYTLDFQAKAVVQLLDHYKIKKAHVVGVSLGGLVAFNMATLYPDRVDKLVLIDSPGPVFSEADMKRLLTTYSAKDLAGVVLPNSPAEVRRIFRIAYYKPPPIPWFLLDDVYEDLFVGQRSDQKALAKYLQENLVPLSKRDYRRHDPTLLIWGDHDMLFPVDIAARLKTWYQGKAKLVIVEDAAHMPIMEHPKKVNKVLLDFFK